jgi:hypothetical protein
VHLLHHRNEVLGGRVAAVARVIHGSARLAYPLYTIGTGDLCQDAGTAIPGIWNHEPLTDKDGNPRCATGGGPAVWRICPRRKPEAGGRANRSVEDMNRTDWMAPNDPRLPAAIRSCWALAARLAPAQFPPGVHKYPSVEDMAAARDAWEAEMATRSANLGASC